MKENLEVCPHCEVKQEEKRKEEKLNKLKAEKEKEVSTINEELEKAKNRKKQIEIWLNEGKAHPKEIDMINEKINKIKKEKEVLENELRKM